jgi:ankyrin repeat protein
MDNGSDYSSEFDDNSIYYNSDSDSDSDSDSKSIGSEINAGSDPGSELDHKTNEKLELNLELLRAVEECEHVDYIYDLIYEGADVNTTDVNGNSLLVISITNDLDDITMELLKHSADPNIKTNSGYAPLMLTQSPDIAINLIKHSANVDLEYYPEDPKYIRLSPVLATSYGMTALMLNCFYNRPELVKVLIEGGANVNSVDFKKNTALIYAVSDIRCSKDIIKMLISAGADVNAKNNKNETALHRAVRNYLPLDTIKLLLKYGASTENRDHLGYTPIEYGGARAVCIFFRYQDLPERIMYRGLNGHAFKDISKRVRSFLHH